jgi:hypothetical protein
MHACNPSTQEVEAGEPQVQGQPRLPSETLKNKNSNKKTQKSKPKTARNIYEKKDNPIKTKSTMKTNKQFIKEDLKYKWLICFENNQPLP